MATKYVLGIMGSPRAHGNTATLLSRTMQALDESIERETIDLFGLDIQGCRGCEGCRKDGLCVVNDDMQTLYPKIERADAIILASPTYFYNITALMKAFIERLYCYEIFHPFDRSVWTSVNELRGGRFALSIAVCEQENQYDMGFTSQVMDRSLQALGYRVLDSVQASGAYAKGEVLHHLSSLQLAEHAGRKLSMILELASDSGRESGV